MLVDADVEPCFGAVFYMAPILSWSERSWETCVNSLEELRPRICEMCINIKFCFRSHVSNGYCLEIFPTTIFHVVLNIDDKITN